MCKYPTLGQTPSTGPKWVDLPAKIEWGFITGVVTVAALAAAAIFLPKKK